MFNKALVATAIAAISGVAFANGGTFAPVPAAPCHVGSFYLGAGISRDRGLFKTDETAVYVDPVAPNLTYGINKNFDWSGDGIDGELFAGYGITFQDHYYVALEGFGDITSNRANFNKSAALFTINPATVLTSAASSAKFQQDWSAGISVIPGVKITDSTMLFARIGWIISKFKLNGVIDTVDIFNLGNGPFPTFYNNNKNLNGVQLGIGLQAMVTTNVAVRTEWDWSRFQNFTANTFGTNVNNSGLNYAAQVTVKHPENDQFKFGVAYYFNMA